MSAEISIFGRARENSPSENSMEGVVLVLLVDLPSLTEVVFF